MNSPAILDLRRTPARQDLAAASLAGQVAAARFVEGRKMQVREAALPMRRNPAGDAPLLTEALHGEIVTIYDEEEGWAWGQLEADGYVGFLPADGLDATVAVSTHRVATLRTFVYPGPGIKLPIVAALSLGAEVCVTQSVGSFAAIAGRGFIWAAHLALVETSEPDFVAVAERFLGVPYLWGGKTSLGLDCSALVQVSLAASGIPAPRDSDMQEREVGNALAVGDGLAGLQRGDLVFWKGHVGIMRDAGTLLHASGHHMMVVSEPLRTARDRILAQGYGPPTSARRL
ncbi:MAG: C40 family peptidase [Methylobacteriaceae bacterium]|nr:C40 family peptidase [Methylobacteriaceae bacterium]